MFKDITIFQKVYESRSITKAAKELYVTQPSVSIQIKNSKTNWEFNYLNVTETNHWFPQKMLTAFIVIPKSS
jgi:Transcriptional regulator